MSVLCYFGHHKCASHWIARVCQALSKKNGVSFTYIDFFTSIEPSLGQWVAGQGNGFLAYANAHPGHVATLQSFKGFHVIRDPRDIIVSGYFSHRNSHHTVNLPELEAHQNKLTECSKEEGIFLEMEYSRELRRNGVDIGLLSSLENWDYQQDNILEIKYEDLIADPAGMYTQIFSFLGLMKSPADHSELLSILDHYSFKNLSGGRTRGTENKQNHFRKGVSGDWKNHFSQDHIDFFKQEYGDLLIRLDYEQDNNW